MQPSSAPEPVVAPDVVHGRVQARMEFTGSGAEYFRVWVVNLLLTLLTLGVYSAWAKVRKARYFCQNTRLAGFAFDYRGQPLAILRGRVLGLLLLGLYTLGPNFGRRTALVSMTILALLAPWIFLKAQRFKLTSTSWRGLTFGFGASTREVYACLAPGLFLWCVSAISTEPQHFVVMGAVSLVGVGCVPWLHHRLKALQHSRATYGDRSFAFAPAVGRFYVAYLVTFGIAIVCIILFVLLLERGSRLEQVSGWPVWMVGVLGYGSWLLSYVVLSPYLSAKLQQAVWSNTQCGGACFRTEIRPVPLFQLIAKNVALTLVTLGLYWPFAAVALARYRIECVTVLSDVSLDGIASGVRGVEPSATGDAAVDLFGLDIGL